MNNLVKLIVCIIISCGITIPHFTLTSEIDTSISQSYNWEGKWKYESPSGKLLFIIHLEKTGDQKYTGIHSMVDQRIHGGANDSYATDKDGNVIASLTNSKKINSETLEFKFYSGYTDSYGKAQLEVVNNNNILFRISDPPSHFETSPLGNLVYQFDGYNSTSDGVKLTRQ